MFWKIVVKMRQKRSNWIKMITTDLVVGAVDAIADREEADAAQPGAIQVDVTFLILCLTQTSMTT